MQSAEQLTAALLQRTGIRPGITSQKVASYVARIPEAERFSHTQRLLLADTRSAEWQAFVEHVLIHETYFFRHESQLQFLGTKVLPELLRERLRTGRHEFKIWCAACSSGEEAYTAGLMLRDALKSSPEFAGAHWHVQVTGTDLSDSVLAVARKGEYTLTAGLNSFREVPQFARHHFSAVLDGLQKTWRADEQLRRSTTFQLRNLVGEPAPVVEADLVLCRNVLIYLDEEPMRQALATLTSALRPGGVLVLGPADLLKDAEALGLTLLADQRALFWKKKGGPR